MTRPSTGIGRPVRATSARKWRPAGRRSGSGPARRNHAPPNCAMCARPAAPPAKERAEARHFAACLVTEWLRVGHTLGAFAAWSLRGGHATISFTRRPARHPRAPTPPIGGADKVFFMRAITTNPTCRRLRSGSLTLASTPPSAPHFIGPVFGECCHSTYYVTNLLPPQTECHIIDDTSPRGTGASASLPQPLRLRQFVAAVAPGGPAISHPPPATAGFGLLRFAAQRLLRAAALRGFSKTPGPGGQAASRMGLVA